MQLQDQKVRLVYKDGKIVECWQDNLACNLEAPLCVDMGAMSMDPSSLLVLTYAENYNLYALMIKPLGLSIPHIQKY